MPPTKLSTEEAQERAKELPDWALSSDRISKRFEFEDFIAAFGWMAQVAIVAEKMNHHPEWKNVYRTVEVELSTHDVGGLSESDFALAAEMNRLAKS